MRPSPSPLPAPSPSSGEVRFLRGGHPESTHRVFGAVVGVDGTVRSETEPGAAARPLFLRSLAKPFQALLAVEAGVMTRFGLAERHLAAACGTHVAGEAYVRCVRELLAACGLEEAHLACGAVAGGAAAHCCAANHALALAHCLARGWPLADYLEPKHPLQRDTAAWLETHVGLGGVTSDAIDGCGMPAYRMPLERLAKLYGRLAKGELGAAGREVAEAMRHFPELVGAEEGAPDTLLMQAEPSLLVKEGSEGTLVAATREGDAVVLKVEDGAERALRPAAVQALREGLGLPANAPAVERLAAAPVVRLRDGAAVGECVLAVTWRPVERC